MANFKHFSEANEPNRSSSSSTSPAKSIQAAVDPYFKSELVPGTVSISSKASLFSGYDVLSSKASLYSVGDILFGADESSITSVTDNIATITLAPESLQSPDIQNTVQRIFSSNIQENISVKKLMQSSGKKIYCWTRKIIVKINSKMEVKIFLFLYPKITEDNLKKAKLLVRAELNDRLHEKLGEGDMDCSVKIKTKVKDKDTGKKLEPVEKEVSIDSEQVNFFQDLLLYNQLQDTMRLLNVSIKVDFITRLRNKYNFFDQDEFLVVETM